MADVVPGFLEAEGVGRAETDFDARALSEWRGLALTPAGSLVSPLGVELPPLGLELLPVGEGELPFGPADFDETVPLAAV